MGVSQLFTVIDVSTHTEVQRAALQAFCAGGDVKGAVLSAQAGRQHDAVGFFRTEYGEQASGHAGMLQ